MIIVSQEKEIIVNFDNIVYIDIDDNNDNNIIAETDGDCVDLGQYKTKERAKEVLQGIVDFYILKDIGDKPMNPDVAISVLMTRKKGAFYMPEE